MHTTLRALKAKPDDWYTWKVEGPWQANVLIPLEKQETSRMATVGVGAALGNSSPLVLRFNPCTGLLKLL